MTWFRVDDGFADHPKLESLESDPAVHALAIAAWTLMGTDCARRRTDGLFTEARLRRVLPWPEAQVDQARGALLASGLWVRFGDQLGFHDWADYQPTKAELDADRKAATERQKRWREKRRQDRNGGVDASTNASTDASTNDVTDGVSRRDGRRSSGASTVDAPVDATPSRPVPSRPNKRDAAVAAHSRPSSDLISALITGTREAYKSIKVPEPKQTHVLTWNGWVEIARWCEQKAEIENEAPITVAQTLVTRFLRNKKAKANGYHLSFLSENPTEWWETAA